MGVVCGCVSRVASASIGDVAAMEEEYARSNYVWYASARNEWQLSHQARRGDECRVSRVESVSGVAVLEEGRMRRGEGRVYVVVVQVRLAG